MSVVLETIPITERSLLYHDEIPTSIIRDAALRCISAGASWHFPNGSLVDESSGGIEGNYFQQLMLSAESRLTRNILAPVPTEDDLNGLWTCRLSGNETGAIPKELYSPTLCEPVSLNLMAVQTGLNSVLVSGLHHLLPPPDTVSLS